MARILIVDDEPSDRLILETVLQRAGYDTRSAGTGEEALDAIAAETFDVVVTDLQMRDVHGFEVITRIRDMPAAPGVVAVSATGPYQLDMANALGAACTLGKPVDPAALLDAVALVLALAGPTEPTG